jgi:hypothetical protein
MLYTYDPHRHVKIWLSKDETCFLTLINRLRLIRMRVKNPTDTIFFIYDSDLLTKKSVMSLVIYCNEYNILPLDVRDLIPQCTTIDEKNLIKIYQDEISNLNSGGNLAAASDILRWLRPIYILGTYSDFDVEINTAGLAAKVNVSSNLLFNFGSVRYISYEHLSFNNDVIAVVDPDAAFEQIKQIQQAIFSKCSFILHVLKEGERVGCIDYLNLSAREFRNKIRIDCQYNKEELELLSVLETTGPKLIKNILFGMNSTHAYPHNTFMQNIAPYSLKHYKLDDNFISTSSIKLHSSSLMRTFFGDTSKNKIFSDLSWLDSGAKKIKNKENKMRESARKITSAFKKQQALKRKSLPGDLLSLKYDIESIKSRLLPDNFSLFNPNRWIINSEELRKLTEIYCYFHNNAFEAKKLNKSNYYSAKPARFFKIITTESLIIDRASLLSKQATLFSLVDKESGDLQLGI